MEYEDLKSNDIQSSCDLFARFFQTSYNCDILTNIDSLYPDITPLIDFKLQSFSEQDVLESLKEIDVSKKSGFDMIPPILLSKCSYSLCSVLALIFNKSLQTGVFLKEWKISYIDPVYKSGLKHLVKNYRPISKLSVIPKLFEKMVTQRLYFAVKNSLSQKQHGFVKGRSTCTNLSLFANYCNNHVEKGRQVDVLYTDFVKAFDRVHHGLLLQKLKMLGLNASFLQWLDSYLCDRKQAVKIDECVSNLIDVVSGLPQGSHLGPLLFIIFINDLPSIFKYCNCLMYADDVKVFTATSSLEDCLLMQLDIQNFLKWCDYNHLQLNYSKCKIFSVSKSSSLIDFEYKFYDVSLLRVIEVNDLGVIFDSKLDFRSHVDYIVSKGNSLLGFLKRNSKDFKDAYTLKTLFMSIVLPVLEYCCVVWSPFYENNILRIERVQKRFTLYALRKLNWVGSLPDYKSRCSLIDLKTLKCRRQVQCILFIKDIIDNRITSCELLSLIPFHVPSRVFRNRNELFYPPLHRTNYGLNEPITRSLNLFNMVYNEIDLCMNRDCFKKKILQICN